MEKSKTTKSFVGFAKRLMDEQIKKQVPRDYLFALYAAQYLEYSLDLILQECVSVVQENVSGAKIDYKPDLEKKKYWGIGGYLARLEAFFPKEKYQKFYDAVKRAQDKRNKFIHEAFKVKYGDHELIIMPTDNFYMNPEARRRLQEWIKTFKMVFIEIRKINKKLGLLPEEER